MTFEELIEDLIQEALRYDGRMQAARDAYDALSQEEKRLFLGWALSKLSGRREDTVIVPQQPGRKATLPWLRPVASPRRRDAPEPPQAPQAPPQPSSLTPPPETWAEWKLRGPVLAVRRFLNERGGSFTTTEVRIALAPLFSDGGASKACNTIHGAIADGIRKGTIARMSDGKVCLTEKGVGFANRDRENWEAKE